MVTFEQVSRICKVKIIIKKLLFNRRGQKITLSMLNRKVSKGL